MNRNETQEYLAGRQVMAAALASAVADPRSPLASGGEMFDGAVIHDAWEVVKRATAHLDKGDLGLGERLPAHIEVAPLVEWLATDADTRERVYQSVFGLVISTLCPSYETEYCPWKDATHRAQEMADIAGFYCAFGLTPNRAAPERVDCIALEIEFTAIVLERWRAALGSNERAGVCEDALRAFETDHLCWWAPTFGRLLEKRATDLAGNDAPEKEAGLFRLAGVAKLLCGWLTAERTALGIEPRRRLIEPSVAPLEDDNGCGSCSGCATDTASSACPS